MGCADSDNANRMATGGRAISIANCKLQIANCKLAINLPSPLARLPKGEGTVDGRGVTLVEMLIVISIIVILTVTAIKVVQPDGTRRVREAARAVNVYLSSAQHRAMEIGRPCGVIFHRANGTNFPTAATVLDQCESPPPYAGDETNSVVQVQDWTIRPDGNPYFKSGCIVLKVQVKFSQFSSNMLRPGDLMQLNGQGPFYTLVYDDVGGSYRTQPPYTSPPAMNPPANPAVNDFQPVDAKGNYDPNGFYNFNPPSLVYDPSTYWITSHWLTLMLNPKTTPVQTLPWPKFTQAPTGGVWSSAVPFLVLRQPVKTAASPLRLPEGAVVDLDFSGTDYQTFLNPPGNYYDVAIVFSSNGAVEGYYWNNAPYPALGPIFILVGSRSRVRDFINQPLPANPNLNDLPNWADLANVWITINYQTGLVTTDENFAINFATQTDSSGNLINWTTAPNWNMTNTSNWPYFINLSRTYARQSQNMGGR